MKSVHILLVEDNEGDILLTREALEEARIVNQLSVMKDGKEAIDFLSKEGKYENAESPDIILLDVNLPKKNGHEVLKYVKGNEALRHIPVIMLTTSSSEKDIDQSYDNYANCYITKPVEVNEFLAVISTIENYWVSIVKLPTKSKKIMAKDNKAYKVLVIEDNEGDFIFVEDFLTEQIFNPVITRAGNFKEASSILANGSNNFDVILLDLTLPDKTGQELVNEMLRLASSCPVIILTGFTDISFSIKSISQGVSDYLIKDDLNAAILYKSIIYSIERKLAELERAKVTNDLIQRNNDLEQFTYIVSHNLRAPLANIIGLTDALHMMELDQEEQKQMTGDLTASVQKLDNVIKDLNNILQMKREVSEKREIVRFSELLKDIQLSIRNMIRTEEVHFISDFSQVDEMLTLKSYLYSVFFNLISNSIKYRQPQVNPIIQITTVWSGNTIEVLFKDNGLGIDMEKRGQQVFGLYKRFHSHTEGKGMGLYMVKTQVEALGGNISIHSEVNKGTEFRIEFENQRREAS